METTITATIRAADGASVASDLKAWLARHDAEVVAMTFDPPLVRPPGPLDDEAVRVAYPPDEAAVSTADLKGRAPQEVFERLEGETEAEFSARMARVQSQLAEEQRRRRAAPTLNPIDAFKGVFNQ